MLERLDLRTIGGACAVMGVALFIIGAVVGAATGGPSTVIPETGDGLVTWVRDVVGDRTGFERSGPALSSSPGSSSPSR